MKKILSVILSITLLMSMSVTAFAADDRIANQVVSVEIPAPHYDYTVTMPADCSLTYNDTDWQHIGDVTVESENWDNINSAPYDGIELSWDINFDKHLVNENGDTIQFARELKWNGQMVETGGVILTHNDTVGFYLKVADWSGAAVGTTYTKTITYRVRFQERSE